MKNIFSHFINTRKENIERVWNGGASIFIFDANVLLNLYRLLEKARQINFIESLELINDRIWIPHQVGLEYFKNRPKVITDQKEKYNNFLSDINKLVGDIKSANSNPFFSKELTDKIMEVKSGVYSEVENIQNKYDKQLSDDQIKSKKFYLFF